MVPVFWLRWTPAQQWDGIGVVMCQGQCRMVDEGDLPCLNWPASASH